MREGGGGDVMKERCGMRVMEEGCGRIRDERIDRIDIR